MILRRALAVLVAALFLIAVGLAAYAVRVRACAQSLINSASQIHTVADAEREITAWRKRSDVRLNEETSHDGDHSYDIRADNSLLYRLHIAPPTMVGMTITVRDGQLRSIILAMFTGREPNTTSGVWVQEWFESGAASNLHVNDKDKPWKATIEFSSSAPKVARERAFALNAECFVRPGGCRSAEKILPGVWELGVGRN